MGVTGAEFGARAAVDGFVTALVVLLPAGAAFDDCEKTGATGVIGSAVGVGPTKPLAPGCKS